MSHFVESGAWQLYEKARVKTVLLNMNAGGWGVDLKDEAQMVDSSIFIYVLDSESDWCWMCAIGKQRFQEATLLTARLNVEHASSAVAGLIRERGTSEQNQQWSYSLAYALTAYIAKTKTFAMAEEGRKVPHFGIINYGRSERLRPFALPGSDRFALPAQYFLEAARSVMDIDSKNHPEWSHPL